MDRQIVYPGAIPLETDILNTNKNMMIALSKLSAAVLGTSTIANGFAVTPTAPASLQVNVAAGEIYGMANIDATAYSSLAADTTHAVLKQGIALDPQLLTLTAPGTSGYSVNYLVQATYQDQDANAVALPYYNSSNPSQPWSGPDNTGQTQYTARKGVAVVQAKAGIAAATGSQQTPAPDSGYIGLYVVTVAYGQAQITTSNISLYANAPFIPTSLINAAGLNLPNIFSQPQTVPNATQSGHAVNFGQLNSSITGLKRTFLSYSAGTALTSGAVSYNTDVQWLGSSSGTIQLPVGNTLPVETSFHFFNEGTSAVTVSINLATSSWPWPDVLRIGSSTYSSITIQPGGDVLIRSSGSSEFECISGSGLYQFNPIIVANATQSQHAVALGQLALAIGTTAPQFDNGLKFSTTAFVQRALGSFSNFGTIAASRNLSVSDIGTALAFSGNYTLTLPTPSSLGLINGAACTLYSTSSTGTISAGSGVTLSMAGSISSLAVNAGQSCTIVVVSGTQWQVISSTAGLSQNADFGSSLAGNGYQKLPNGLIVQWGSRNSTASTDTLTLPLTFPNAGLQVYVTDSGNGRVAFGASFASTSTVTVYCASAGNLYRYFAIGN
ncbi:gp53-like domain-containing protein [Chromobacterium haemolyticum]|uniref:gp53-like domain-containing protein n=1 Tax=Chromobacterium haemolyticum TaxID=394935 RepID=UPI00131961AE|nr:hypothetical protein [Chromobacterium haemolyticum]BBH11693.1 hypothetical protein CH06BL_09410 [Chromobacterium haemolyticum]